MTPATKTTTKAKTTHRVSAAPAATKAAHTTGRYFAGLGGRKTASAHVRVHPGKSGITVNGKDVKEYFKLPKHQMVVRSPLEVSDMKNAVGVTVIVRGSGIASQADAVRHGIAVALVKYNTEHKKILRASGFMTRDARVVERKKYGLKGARRAPQWAKR